MDRVERTPLNSHGGTSLGGRGCHGLLGLAASGCERDEPFRAQRRRAGPGDVGPNRISLADRVLAIEVSDNGPGISEAAAGQLFDPFFTTKEPGEGTGLGLSICARLMESMGGRIDAELDREEGACFLVRLPLRTEVEAEGSERADSQVVAEE